MDVPCNSQPPGAMIGNFQESCVSPVGYTSLRFLRGDEASHDTHSDDTSNISLADEDMTLDSEGQQGFNSYPNDNACPGKAPTCATLFDFTSNIHLETEDMTLDDVIAHCLGVSPGENTRFRDAGKLDTNCVDTINLHLETEDMPPDQVILHGLDVSPDDRASHGDMATLQKVTNDLTLDPVILRGATAAPSDSGDPGDEVATPDTHALPAEDGSLSSMCLLGPNRYQDDKARLDTCRHVTSYIHPVPADIILEAEKETGGDDAEYTIIHDNDVKDMFREDPYETIRSLDENDVEDISQKHPYEKIGL